MGAEQTLTSRNSQENVTSNNALSINDFSSHGLSLQRKASVANNTGLPDSLKSGVESLSGYSLDDVRVHYNSSKPAAVQAYAYTQGTDIHIAPGQERCLPHEAWHVTQQMSGRVSPTTSIGGVAVNDDASLEHEADVMGARASTLQGNNYAPVSRKAWSGSSVRQNKMTSSIVQREETESGPACVALRDDAETVNAFIGKDYKTTYEQDGNFHYGHFDAKYSPKDNKLAVTLPIFYESNGENRVSNERRARYEDNIKKKWSSENTHHHINFNDSRLEPSSKSSSVGWKSKLNSTNVDVSIKPTQNRTEAYFDINAVDGTQINPATNKKYSSGVNRKHVDLRQNSLDRVDEPTDDFVTLNPTAHETGHMFGFDDEYCRKAIYPDTELKILDGGQLNVFPLKELNERGQKLEYKGVAYNVRYFNGDGYSFYYLTDDNEKIVASFDGTLNYNYDLVKRAFGENDANKYAVMHDNTDSADDRRGTSVMRNGDTVEKYHYVTFWDAMVQAIQSDSEYGSTPSPKAPNMHEDWTIE